MYGIEINLSLSLSFVCGLQKIIAQNIVSQTNNNNTTTNNNIFTTILYQSSIINDTA